MDGQLAVSSGVGLRQEGELLHFVRLGTRAWVLAAFVLGLLALILLLNGLVQVALAFSGGNGQPLAGGVMAGVGGIVALAATRCWGLKRAHEALPTSALRKLATLDLGNQTLLDGKGRVLARLSDVRFERRFQVTSSSRRLVVCWPEGELPLVNGDPFAGGLWAIQSALESRGFRIS
jgi:hypothetical protein